ncbi:hypothetical protein [Desulfonatronum thioautotrophicum]|uniref:hypothetical protein n=1 Tax=Desulfonatronum thioautotrophicum TaxID=617001 RepID=UPI0005EAE0D0|nr:hypothetical protein [Desulfonatronum thioautotrophicum]
MRAYLIDELNPTDVQRLASHLETTALKAPVADMFWLEIPAHLLSAEQHKHVAQCGPFVCSLEIGRDWLKVELLLRGRGKLRCSCIAYADQNQRDWILDQVDTMLAELDIPV